MLLMSRKKTLLWILAIVFGLLAIILYFSSIKELDRETARYLGTGSVANVQGTVFAAACAVLCGVNVVGALILSQMEDNNRTGSGVGNIAQDIAKAIWQNELEEKKKQEEAEKERQEAEEKRRVQKQHIEELKQKKAEGKVLEEEIFLEEISEEKSMLNIAKIWENYQLKELHADADAFILKYKNAERIYGPSNNIQKIKEDLANLLLGEN